MRFYYFLCDTLLVILCKIVKYYETERETSQQQIIGIHLHNLFTLLNN